MIDYPTEQLALAPEAPVKAHNRKVPLRRIVVEGATVEQVDRDLVDSIRELGVLEPVILQQVEADVFEVIDGRRRTLAAREAGLKSIPARVVEISGWLGQEVLSILLNEQRGPNPYSELLAIERLMAAGKTERDIAKATGMDVATIRKRLKLTRLIPELRANLETGVLKVSLAEQVAVLPEALQAQLSEKWTVSGKLTSADIHAVREVRQAEATAPLIEVIAQTPATTTRGWHESVTGLLKQAIDLIPEDEGWAWTPLVELSHQLQAAIQEAAS